MERNKRTFALNGDGVTHVTVEMNSPSARNALEALSDDNDSKAVREALCAAADIEDAETALSWLKSEWETTQGQAVRDALRYRYNEVLYL